MSNDAQELDGLLAIFNRVCASLELDQHDAPVARAIARNIIDAALAGEYDAEGLYQLGLRTVSLS